MLANPSQVSQVGANYAAVYLSVPAPADAPPEVRNLIDMTDAVAQVAMKRAIETLPKLFRRDVRARGETGGITCEIPAACIAGISISCTYYVPVRSNLSGSGDFERLKFGLSVDGELPKAVRLPPPPKPLETLKSLVSLQASVLCVPDMYLPLNFQTSSAVHARPTPTLLHTREEIQ